MSLQSDFTFNVSKLRPESVSESEKQMTDTLVAITAKGPRWYDVGAAKYRQMRENGETALPKPIRLEEGKDFNIPSRDKGRDIPCRFITPEHGGKVQGVFMHIHGGGWVLMSEKDQDVLMKRIAEGANLAVISVGYRLAPEHPFPQGPEDCYDAAEWLVDNSNAKFGAPLKFAGGESAGAHLTALSAFHLLKSRPSFAFSGLLLNFGAYDLSMLPHLRNISKPLGVLTPDVTREFLNAFLPNTTLEERRDPSISPFYADLSNMKLPPALFTCGTEDCLLEDTVMMAVRWQMAGGEAVTKLFPGAAHGFIAFEKAESATEGRKCIEQFLKEKLRV